MTRDRLLRLLKAAVGAMVSEGSQLRTSGISVAHYPQVSTGTTSIATWGRFMHYVGVLARVLDTDSKCGRPGLLMGLVKPLASLEQGLRGETQRPNKSRPNLPMLLGVSTKRPGAAPDHVIGAVQSKAIDP